MQRSNVKGMDVVKEHPAMQRSEVEGMDMVKDTTMEVDVDVVESGD
jgi:hypothetical protein